MKKPIFIIAAIALAIYGQKVYSENPVEIIDPVYLESRVNIAIPNTSRDVEVVLLGEMATHDDCARRLDHYHAKLLEDCNGCTIRLTECKTDIGARNEEIFADRKAPTAYLSLSKGNRFERNGRLILWGLNDEEARMVCNAARDSIGRKYRGTVKCI